MVTDPNTTKYQVENHKSQQSLGEMELWPPPQGTLPHIIPLDIELRFDKQIIRSPKGDISASLSGAEIQLVLEGFKVVRGSRFGDEINDPYVVADVTQSVRTGLEAKTESGFDFDVTISTGTFGKLIGLIRRRRTSKSEFSVDNIAKVAVRLYRIIARNKNRWSIVEPKAPHILQGRYLGERHSSQVGEISSPLCLLTAVSAPARAKVFLRANLSAIRIIDEPKKGWGKISRNKEAVIGQIVRLSVSRQDHMMSGVREAIEQESVLLGYSTLRYTSD